MGVGGKTHISTVTLREAVNAYHNRLSAPGSDVMLPITIKHVTGGGDGGRAPGGDGEYQGINYF